MNKINWVKVMEDNSEAILTAITLAKKESYGGMSGWHVDVEISESGEVWTGGLASQGSQSMSSFNGETLVITQVESWEVEIDEEYSIKTEKKIYAEYQAQEEDGYDAWEFMKNNYPDIRQDWINETRDYEISEFDAMDIYDRALEDQQNLELMYADERENG